MIIPSNIDFSEYINMIGEQESQELKFAGEFTDSTIDRLINGKEVHGRCLPWNKTHDHIRLRPAELSIWAGINGHRKSMILGQVMLWLAKECRVCIASLEMEPESTLSRMAMQAATCKPTEQFARQILEYLDQRVVIYDQLDTVEAERILGMVNYAASELGCEHIVIDSLTKCGLGTDDYTAQKKFVDRLAWIAKRLKVHIHLVCHMRKGMDETRKPGKFDVRGASEITDLADNVFVTWKDKKRDEARQRVVLNTATADDQALLEEDKPDQILTVAKQRHGEYEGSFGFWFHGKSLQFTPNPDNRPLPYVMFGNV